MRTENKKHREQMTQEEKVVLQNKVSHALKNIQNVHVSHHAIERFEQKAGYNLDKSLLIDSLLNSKPVEYKVVNHSVGNNEERVVLRSSKTSNNKEIVLVYSLTNNVIITFWLNSASDKHSTLDLSKYNKNLTIA